MFKKSLSVALCGAMILMLAAQPVIAKSKAEKEAQFTAKVRAGVAKLGVGPDTRVEVKLRDKTKLKGYISEATADAFSVTDPKTGTTTAVAYPDVTKVKGNNLSTGATIAIAVGLAVGATILVLYLMYLAGES